MLVDIGALGAQPRQQQRRVCGGVEALDGQSQDGAPVGAWVSVTRGKDWRFIGGYGSYMKRVRKDLALGFTLRKALVF